MWQVAYLSNQNEHDQPQADPAAVHAADGLEGDLVDCVAVEGPRAAETDVREADAAPGEESGQAREGEQPVEDDGALGVEVDIGQAPEDQDDADAPERAARAVDVWR